MNIFILLSMAGGLALFLYGMNMLGSGLEKLSGGTLEKTLEKMTSNIFKSVLLGALVTAAIQSSSATTVIVVGLVNAGILKLTSSVGIIMGANIGTTITGQILRLGDLDNNESVSVFLKLLKPTTLAPLIAVIGIVLFMVSKRQKTKVIGEVLLGFGILFNGMFLMTDAVKPLSDLPAFKEIFATLSNPLLGILAGAVITAIIQSSSASVGILQAIASTGAITYSSAIPIILGQNIGTCVTSLIASLGTSKNAKRTAMVHLYFNLIGTAIFFIGIYAIKSTIGFPFWDSQIDMGGIANVHTIFNVVVTILFIPFSSLLAKLAILTIPYKKGEQDTTSDILSTLDDRFLVAPSLALEQCDKVVEQMGIYSKENFINTTSMIGNYDPKLADQIYEIEDVIDHMEDTVGMYLLKLTDCELTDSESKQITHLLKMVSEFERVGDYTINILESIKNLYDNGMSFSANALKEIQALCAAVCETIDLAAVSFATNNIEIARTIEPLEETIDVVEDSLKLKHINRLKEGRCSVEVGVVFLEMLTNLERISDHCSNAGVYIIGYNSGQVEINRHEYLRRIHQGETSDYNQLIKSYHAKYFSELGV